MAKLRLPGVIKATTNTERRATTAATAETSYNAHRKHTATQRFHDVVRPIRARVILEGTCSQPTIPMLPVWHPTAQNHMPQHKQTAASRRAEIEHRMRATTQLTRRTASRRGAPRRPGRPLPMHAWYRSDRVLFGKLVKGARRVEAFATLCIRSPCAAIATCAVCIRLAGRLH